MSYWHTLNAKINKCSTRETPRLHPEYVTIWYNTTTYVQPFDTTYIANVYIIDSINLCYVIRLDFCTRYFIALSLLWWWTVPIHGGVCIWPSAGPRFWKSTSRGFNWLSDLILPLVYVSSTDPVNISFSRISLVILSILYKETFVRFAVEHSLRAPHFKSSTMFNSFLFNVQVYWQKTLSTLKKISRFIFHLVLTWFKDVLPCYWRKINFLKTKIFDLKPSYSITTISISAIETTKNFTRRVFVLFIMDQLFHIIFSSDKSIFPFQFFFGSRFNSFHLLRPMYPDKQNRWPHRHL